MYNTLQYDNVSHDVKNDTLILNSAMLYHIIQILSWVANNIGYMYLTSRGAKYCGHQAESSFLVSRGLI